MFTISHNDTNLTQNAINAEKKTFKSTLINGAF